MTVLSTLLPEGRQQFLDASGAPLVGGLVHFYVPNTTTPKNTYQDSGNVTLNTNPVVLDDLGSAAIYGTGQYTMALYDNLENLIYTALTAAVPLTGQFLEFDTNGNFTINVGPNLFADTTGRLIQGLNVVNPPGATYIMTDNDRGAAIGTESASGNLTVTLPDPDVVLNGYYALFHHGAVHAMTIISGSANIFTTQYNAGTNTITLPNPQSFLGLYADSGNWYVWTGSADMTYQAQTTLVYSETPQSIPNATPTARTWTTAEFDALGLWNSSTPTRLTVPTGATKVKVYGNSRFAYTTATAGFKFSIQKNGATFTGSPYLETATAGFGVYPAGNVTSAEIFVTGGDYFEMFVEQDTGGAWNTENNLSGVNWFSMEILQWG